MFYVYSKLEHGSYLIYDDSDHSLDKCSVEEIRGYLKTGIKIKGASINGKSMKLGINPPKEAHLVQGVRVDDMLQSTAIASFLLKYSNNVYTVCKGKTPLAVLNISLEHGMIMGGGFVPLVRSKSAMKDVFKFIFSKYNINGLSAVTMNNSINLLESVGASFEFQIPEQKQWALDHEGEYLFSVEADDF